MKKNNRNIFLLVLVFALVLILTLIIYMFFYNKKTLETMTTINIYSDEECKVNNKSNSESIAPPYEENEKMVSEPEPAPQTNNEASFGLVQDKAENTDKADKADKADNVPVDTNTEITYTGDETTGTSRNDAIKEQSTNYSTTFTNALS